MKIAILGAGNVGGSLGLGWANAGHEIIFGVRDASSPKVKKLIADAKGHVRATIVRMAAAEADVIALTVPWDAAQETLKNTGDLHGKILLDCTNPLKPDLSGLVLGYTISAGEQVARWAGSARVVKIFNTTGFANMANPIYPRGPSMMLYCGDDAAAKAIASQLATDLGFETFDLGPLSEARLLEPLALIWIHLAVFQKMGTNFAFQLVHR